MAQQHVGKRWPLIAWPDFDTPSATYHGGFFAPRRWRIKNTGTTSGTLAAKWQDVETVGEVYEIAADRQSINWEIKCPTDSAAIVTLNLSWFEHDTTEGGQFWRNIWWRIRLKYVDGGSTYSDGLLLQQSGHEIFRDSFSTSVVGISQPGGQFPSPSNPTDFLHMGSTKFACSTWAEQESAYHPYRYGPP